MDEYRIFVSRSFDSRDKDLVDTLLRFCRAAGFPPIKVERPSPSLPRDKVREAISDSRVFLGLLTQDHDRASGATKEWLTTEIGMAEFAGLPIVLFIEDGVSYRPADHFTSYVGFSRDDITSLWVDVVEALVELRSNPRVLAGNPDGDRSQPYRFVVDDVEFEVTAGGFLRQIRHLEVESEIAMLQALKPISKIITSSRSLGYHESSFDFIPGRNAEGAELEIRRNDPAEVSYQVCFAKPLPKAKHAQFTVIHESRGSLPLSQEDLQLANEESYGTARGVSRQGHAIKVPTDRLSLSLRFPEGYPIDECMPKISVTLRDRVGESSFAESESERVSRELKRRHNRLEIEVDNPKIDHAYYFEWTPPSECDVPEPLRGTLNRGA